jgi:hypothetical protein
MEVCPMARHGTHLKVSFTLDFTRDTASDVPPRFWKTFLAILSFMSTFLAWRPLD